MKINADNSGNYSIHSVNQRREPPHQESKVKQTKDDGNSAFAGKEKIKEDKNISEEEKNFFAAMYPLNKNEIMDYHYYQKTGKPSGIVLGSLFDKKG
ncbi:MAG TPA: hypothetical protein VMT35_14620 [Ignavibacteriaceae bacterium]|jgi:hypothetical protein|nr:hypothetical protein [Ignavibacteriaceae bacterium]